MQPFRLLLAVLRRVVMMLEAFPAVVPAAAPKDQQKSALRQSTTGAEAPARRARGKQPWPSSDDLVREPTPAYQLISQVTCSSTCLFHMKWSRFLCPPGGTEKRRGVLVA